MPLTKKQLETLKRNNENSNYITREAIRGALYILMETKPFPKITITEIINRSGVSRSAFYRNYKSKEDILNDSVNEIKKILSNIPSDSLSENWEQTFHILRQYKNQLDLIIKAGLEYHLLDQINHNLNYESGQDFYCAMYNGIFFNTIIYWVKSGMPGNSHEAKEQVLNAYEKFISDISKYS